MKMNSMDLRAGTLRAALLGSTLCLAPALCARASAQAVDTPTASAAAATPAPLPTTVAAPLSAANVSEVVVTGQRQKPIITEKRDAMGVVDGISADELQKLPNSTIAEALIHVTGVSVTPNNDNERGRNFAQDPAIRGLDSSYNNVMIDGLPLASTNFTGVGVSSRAVALDAVPSSIVSEIQVYKTYSPDRDPEAVGGGIELTTRSAYDNGGAPFLMINAKGGYNSLNSEPYPQSPFNYHGDVTFSHVFGDHGQFGVVVNAVYEHSEDDTYDNATTDNTYYNYYTAAGASLTSPTAGSFAIPQQSKAWIIEETNEKADLTTKFEYRPNRALQTFVELGYYYDGNDGVRNENILTAAGTPTITSATTGSFPKGDVEVGGQYSPLHRTSYDALVGAKYTFAPHDSLTLRLSDSFSTWRQPEFMVKYIDSTVSSPTTGTTVATLPANAFSYNLYSNYSNFNMNPAQFNNPNNYFGDYWRYRDRVINTSNDALKLDYEHNAEADSVGLGFKAGLDIRQTRNRLLFRTPDYEPNAVGTTTLASAQGSSNFNLPNYSTLPFLLINVTKAFQVLQNNMSLFHLTNQNASDHVNNFWLRENTADGYGMFVFNASNFHAMAGVREDAAHIEVTGYQQQPNPQGVANSPFDGGPYPAYQPITTKSDYSNPLPAASVDYEPLKTLQLRAAYSQTIGRPDYSSYSPSSGITENYGAGSGGANTLTITQGNPNLKPRLSSNYDLALDWYFEPNGLFSVAPFYKSIKDEIYSVTTNSTVLYDGVNLAATTTEPINAASTSVQGVETELVKGDYGQYSPWLKGFGTDFNYTLLAGKAVVDYSATVNGVATTFARHIAGLVNQPKYVANFILNYDRGPVFGALSVNTTGRSLRTLTANAVWQDVYWTPRTQVDLKFGYHIRRDLDFSAAIQNLNNETTKSVTGLGKNLLKDESYVGQTLWFGLTYRPGV
jgi:TonB-dependent receptor